MIIYVSGNIATKSLNKKLIMRRRGRNYKALYECAEETFPADYVELFLSFAKRVAKRPISSMDKIPFRRFERFKEAFTKQVDVC